MLMLGNAVFWFSIAFILFFILAGKKILGGITTSLDQYKNKIKQNVMEAQSFKDEAQNLLSQTQRKHRQVLQDAEDIIKQAKEEASLIKEKATKDIEGLMKKVDLSLKDKATQLEAKTIAELKAATMQMSLDAARNLLQSKLSKDEQEKLIQESISCLANQMN